MEDHAAAAVGVGVVVEVGDPARVESRGAADDAVDLKGEKVSAELWFAFGNHENGMENLLSVLVRVFGNKTVPM